MGSDRIALRRLSSGEGLIWQVRDPIIERDQGQENRRMDRGRDGRRRR